MELLQNLTLPMFQIVMDIFPWIKLREENDQIHETKFSCHRWIEVREFFFVGFLKLQEIRTEFCLYFSSSKE